MVNDDFEKEDDRAITVWDREPPAQYTGEEGYVDYVPDKDSSEQDFINQTVTCTHPYSHPGEKIKQSKPKIYIIPGMVVSLGFESKNVKIDKVSRFGFTYSGTIIWKPFSIIKEIISIPENSPVEFKG